jgi:hypothetical protein
LERYFASSLKATAEVDWDDAASREAFLTAIIHDGERVLEFARERRSSLVEGSAEDERIVAAVELLTQLLWQDVEPTEDGYRIKEGTAKERVPSVHDPEQRHGRKSHGQSFTGHKGAVAVDTQTQLITAVEALPGNASDGESAAALVAASEVNTGGEVEQVVGDTVPPRREEHGDAGGLGGAGGDCANGASAPGPRALQGGLRHRRAGRAGALSAGA